VEKIEHRVRLSKGIAKDIPEAVTLILFKLQSITHNQIIAITARNKFTAVLLRDLFITEFDCKAWLTGLHSQLGNIQDFKNGGCCFSCFNAQHLRVAQRMK